MCIYQESEVFVGNNFKCKLIVCDRECLRLLCGWGKISGLSLKTAESGKSSNSKHKNIPLTEHQNTADIQDVLDDCETFGNLVN
jgi:hypothetical protein